MERSLALVALFAAFIAALGTIPPLTVGLGVPITAQTLGIMLCGTVLGARRGGLAALLFLALVALGLPLLSGGRGGLGVFGTGSVGYLLAWPLGAFVTGWIMENMRSLPLGLSAGIASVIGGIVVVHVFGIIGLIVMLDLGPFEAIIGDSVYIPGDFIKAVLAAVITAALARARPASVLSRA